MTKDEILEQLEGLRDLLNEPGRRQLDTIKRELNAWPEGPLGRYIQAVTENPLTEEQVDDVVAELKMVAELPKAEDVPPAPKPEPKVKAKAKPVVHKKKSK
jgi:hypothetical protein